MWLITTGSVPSNLPYRLDVGEFLVGRDQTAHVILADVSVSRRHARLMRSGSSLVVEDLGSANGTFVNGRPAINSKLHVGDEVRFGHILCAVSRTSMLVDPADGDEPTLPIQINGSRQPAARDELTPTQQVIVDHILAGYKEAEIARLLNRSPHTIHAHLKSLYRRFGVHSRAQLMAKFIRRR